MKKLTLLAVSAMLIAVQSAAWAQTITIDSISGTHFCAGDPISATFTVTGMWGHNNAFSLQLSNDSGTFDNGFTNLGSIKDTTPGSFTIVTSIPVSSYYSALYRVRVIGAVPYTESGDNGSNIFIGEKAAHVTFMGKIHESDAAVGLPISFDLQPNYNIDTNNQVFNQNSDTEHIIFGRDATPPESTMMEGNLGGPGVSVTYNSPGPRTVFIESVAPGGCSVMDSFKINVFGCDKPIVPHDAIIVTSDSVARNNVNKTYWVNPGVSFSTGQEDGDTIFAEAGSSIIGAGGLGQSDDIVYLKKGASSDADWYGVVIYQPGANVDNTNSRSIRTVECPDLTFDYSVAPPNSVMHINDGEGVVAASRSVPSIEVSPNPTSGEVMLSGLPAYSNIIAMNVLGETVQEMRAPADGIATLDLSKLARGTYYVRIASGNSVVTKKVVKE